jgi:hypothetical protein
MARRPRRPPLTMTERPGKKRYLQRDLYNELRWLLCAATEWHMQSTMNEYLDAIGQGTSAYHMQVYTLDSVALHVRSLFEFLTKTATINHFGTNNYLGSTNVVNSDIYRDDWEGPLHGYLMHSQPRPGRRRKLRSRTGARKKLPLNRMPVEFAEEIIVVWQEFANELRVRGDSLARIVDGVLTKAINDARCVRDNEVTQHVLKTKLPRGFSIPKLSWE